MERRSLLRPTVVVGAAAFSGSLWRQAMAYPALPGTSPYGPLQPADANGIMLPAGFSSRVIARSTQTVSGTGHTWHSAPDGGACFADGSGWIYVSNAEVGSGGGGAGAVKFNSGAAITGAYTILSGTHRNCAGGATPWDTWLSCEEVSNGFVYETDPWGVNAAVQRPAMGRFHHEAAAADPVRKVIYLTEDQPDGCFYRFVPTVWGNLSSGTLQVLKEVSGVLSWANVPAPDGSPTPTRDQVSGAKLFNGGEGCHYRSGICYFTTKGDNRVWAYDAAAGTIAVVYDDNVAGAPLTGVDNVTAAAVGDLYVAEDGGNMEMCVITPEDIVAPFLRITGQSSSEVTGPAFNPAGDRLYFSSQRGTSVSGSGGITYEVTGPFRTSL
ncbi:alkaline phosphatase PhoX [Streptomyces sirii]|uniref:alkaline phosphatase PhoX n=1 Tax=Streptomyces sirii TaxID=3127701 RepID=UPI003D369AA9